MTLSRTYEISDYGTARCRCRIGEWVHVSRQCSLLMAVSWLWRALDSIPPLRHILAHALYVCVCVRDRRVYLVPRCLCIFSVFFGVHTQPIIVYVCSGRERYYTWWMSQRRSRMSRLARITPNGICALYAFPLSLEAACTYRRLIYA